MSNRKTINEVFGFPTVAEVEAKSLQRMHEAIESAKKSYEERLRIISEGYQLRADLCAAGVSVGLSKWEWVDEGLTVDLGQRPDPSKEKRKYRAWLQQLATCKRILGPMKDMGRNLGSAKRRTVVQNLQPTNFPSVRVRYVTRLKDGGKCKIVRKRSVGYSQLVCEC